MPRDAAPPAAPHPRLWWQVLLAGLVLWSLAVGAFAVTDNTLLLPSVIFVGSFLTPVTATVWLVERQRYSGTTPQGTASALTPLLLISAFLGAGILGVTVSAVIESMLPAGSTVGYLAAVAGIEESVKLALVWWFARSLTRYQRRDGMVLGACVGLGFAAFETAGYSFSALVRWPDQSADSLLSLVGAEATRALLAPLGHGLWTALVGGALFAAAGTGRLRLTPGVIGWWLLVVGLHFLWDLATPVAHALAGMLTGRPAAEVSPSVGLLAPSQAQAVTSVVLTVLLSACTLVGLALARHEWVKGRALVPGYPHAPTGGDAGP